MVTPLERYEAIAALYYARFGRLAPGKSESPETYRDSNDEENRSQFKTWLNGQALDDAINKIVELGWRASELESRD